MRAFFFRRHLSSAALECSLLGVKRSGPVTAAAPVEAMSCRINVYWLPSQRTTPYFCGPAFVGFLAVTLSCSLLASMKTEYSPGDEMF